MEPFLGEIRLFPWGFTPSGWLPCDGRQMLLQQNAALYSLLGIQYGGDGKTTFNLPDLRGRVPMHKGLGRDNMMYTQGQAGGSETVTLTAANLPQHTHVVLSDATGNATTAAVLPTANVPAVPVNAKVSTLPNLYAPVGSPTQPLDASAVQATGGNAPHENRQPYLVLNYCIAVQGLYPPRD
jgi:microcystin-dependent protein